MRSTLLAGATVIGLFAREAPAHAIQGGTPDYQNGYSVAVATSAGLKCSGTLITPNVVLVARQCVDDFDDKGSAPPNVVDCALNPTFINGSPIVSVATGPGVSDTAVWRSVQSIARPSTNEVCGNDLALLVLTTLVAPVSASPIAPAVNDPPNHPKYSRSFTAIGYGPTTANGSDQGTRRRIGQVAISCVPGDAAFPCPTGFNANEFAGGDGLCGIDMGLAALEQGSFVFGAPVSLGVLSRTGVDGTACVGSIFTRLDVHRDLIVATAESASANWTLYPKPSWAEPPPPTDAGPEEPDAGSGGGGPPTTPTPGGGKTTPDGGASEENAAAPADDGGCRSAPKTAPVGAVLLVGAVAVALTRRRRNAS